MYVFYKLKYSRSGLLGLPQGFWGKFEYECHKDQEAKKYRYYYKHHSDSKLVNHLADKDFCDRIYLHFFDKCAHLFDNLFRRNCHLGKIIGTFFHLFFIIMS